mmetsp:Transcript_20262/g.57933  ORF Transcript_20262/g.57933 Transcript_20262/m.57933 type:complete len:214 (+) Transcript_20262:3453-4094(+)
MARDLALLCVREELGVKLVAELGVEGSAVDDEGADAGDVADQALPPQGEVLRILRPTGVLAGEAGEQLVRAVGLVLERLGAVLQLLHRRLRLGELPVQLGDLLHDLRQLRLGRVQLRHCFGQGSLRQLQGRELGLDDLRSALVLYHGGDEKAQTLSRAARLLGDARLADLVLPRAPVLRGVFIVAEIRLQELNGLVVDRVLVLGRECQQVRKE